MISIALIFALGFSALEAIGQNAGDYQSNTIFGSWSAAASWQRFTGTVWVTAAAPPTSADGIITIRNGHRIDLTTAATIDQVIVATGGQLFIYGGIPTVFTLANGPGNDLEVNGNLVISVNATVSGTGNIVNNSAGTFNLRLTGILSVNTTNNGIMQINGAATFAGNTVTNNATFNHIDNTLNLNNATFINRGLIAFEAVLDSYVSSTGGGIFTNEADGTLYKTSILGSTTWIDTTPGTITFTNRGLVKGFSSFSFGSTATNTGNISPGDHAAGILTVNPTFIAGKAPTYTIDIVSSGFLAGVNFDRVSFSTAGAVDVSGGTLNVSDNGSDVPGTVYVIFNSPIGSFTSTKTFSTVRLAPTLGNLTYNATSITVEKISSQNRYVWIGGSTGAWGLSTNWSPARVAPAASDVLSFSTGTTVTITDVPTQSISALRITNNTTVNLQAATSSKNLTIGNGYMNYLNVDPGSTLNVLPNGAVLLNIFIAGTNSRAVIGGVVNMQNGNFNIGDNVLQLHTTAVPLQKNFGQFAIGSGGAIEFGDALHTSGPAITLPNAIFAGSPTIASITVFRTNGAVLGNQPITVTNSVNLVLGDLTTNAAGRIVFSTTAANPVETATSKIVGYADLLLRPIGTTAFNFLGAVSPAGSNIGSVSLSRITGSAGINTFNGFNSIASTWNIAATAEPSPARTIALSWLRDFDNGANTALQFQDYRFDVGPGWGTVGTLASLQSAANPRTTAPVLTLKISGSWSAADQANLLPIVLGSLEAKQADNTVELNWKTLSEVNSDFFEIQRRGKNEETFSVIGTVGASGTSNQTRQYSFTDQLPVHGVNYYRLRLVDVDHSFDYSKVVSIDFDAGAGFVIYPNPATGNQLTIQFAEAVNGQLSIFDMAQRKVLSRMVTGTPAHEVILDDLALKSGAYIIMLESGGKRVMNKLLVRP